jgi:hypothetical protein
MLSIDGFGGARRKFGKRVLPAEIIDRMRARQLLTEVHQQGNTEFSA